MENSTITEVEVEVEERTSVGDPKVVILHNDDYNTFDHVHKCLVNICKVDSETAWQKTLQVHEKGKCVACEGNDEYLKKIKLKLRAQGLSVTIENA